MVYAQANIGARGRIDIHVDLVSQNWAANTSTVRVHVYLVNLGTSTSFNNGNVSKSITGGGNWSGAGPFSVPAGGSTLWIDQQFTMGHDSAGNLNTYFIGSVGATGTTTFGSGGSVNTGWFALPRIPKRPAAPGPPAFINVNSTSLHAYWGASANENGAAIEGYLLRYWPNAEGSGPYVDHSFENNTSRNVGGLAPGTTYRFVVYAKNGAADNGGYSDSSPHNLVFTPKRPSPPGEPTFSEMLPTSLRVSWAASSDDGGRAIDGYLLRYWPNEEGSGPYTDHSQENNLSRVVTGLNPGQTYRFRVYAHTSAADNNGYSNPSVDRTVMMLAGVWIKTESGIWKMAVPYVKSTSGIWKVAVPYVKSGSNIWKLTN